MFIEYLGTLCSINQKYVSNHILSLKYRNCKEDVHSIALRERNKQKIFEPYKGDVSLFLEIWNKREPDIDAFIKVIQDSLEGVCYIDDKQIKEERIRKIRGDGAGFYALIKPIEDYSHESILKKNIGGKESNV